MISRKFVTFALLLAALPTTVVAQEVDLKFGGQVRPRFEYRNPLVLPLVAPLKCLIVRCADNVILVQRRHCSRFC